MHGEHQFAVGDCSAEQRRRKQLMSPVSTVVCYFMFPHWRVSCIFTLLNPCILETQRFCHSPLSKAAQSDFY